jgi:hypothetical protein
MNAELAAHALPVGGLAVRLENQWGLIGVHWRSWRPFAVNNFPLFGCGCAALCSLRPPFVSPDQHHQSVDPNRRLKSWLKSRIPSYSGTDKSEGGAWLQLQWGRLGAGTLKICVHLRPSVVLVLLVLRVAPGSLKNLLGKTRFPAIALGRSFTAYIWRTVLVGRLSVCRANASHE